MSWAYLKQLDQIISLPILSLKLWAIEAAPILTLIFQASIHQSSVPPDWKQANIVPIFKKKDHTLCSNYRPVSLTCICSKILEHIICSHIFPHLSQHNILYNEQHGFAMVDLVKLNLYQLLTILLNP